MTKLEPVRRLALLTAAVGAVMTAAPVVAVAPPYSVSVAGTVFTVETTFGPEDNLLVALVQTSPSSTYLRGVYCTERDGCEQLLGDGPSVWPISPLAGRLQFTITTARLGKLVLVGQVGGSPAPLTNCLFLYGPHSFSLSLAGRQAELDWTIAIPGYGHVGSDVCSRWVEQGTARLTGPE